jgi:hypothetical protein
MIIDVEEQQQFPDRDPLCMARDPMCVARERFTSNDHNSREYIAGLKRAAKQLGLPFEDLLEADREIFR